MSTGAYINDRSVGRIYAGHPWVFAAEIVKMDKTAAEGSEMAVRTPHGGFMGTGFYNSKSKIPIRIYSRIKGEALDEAFFRQRLLEARTLREEVCGGQDCYRLVWSEADFIPGLIVDRYAEAWVIQTLTYAMDQRKDMFVRLLQELCGAKLIYERNDVASREFEGLEEKTGVLAGTGTGLHTVRLGKALFEVNLLKGQKTGVYLDQIGNHMQVGAVAKGRNVLDCFTYHGGFAIHAALAGAKHVDAIDISKEAVAVAAANAERNGVAGLVSWKAANVFGELTELQKAGRAYDLIILDPPSFTKSRSKVDEALRGYKDINLRALSMLAKGGLLATFCCSHHVDAVDFRNVVLDAAFDARKILRLRSVFGQPPDHPIVPAIAETEYLKGFLFEVV